MPDSTGRLPHRGDFESTRFAWIDELPATWEVRRLKQIGRLRAGAGFPHDAQGQQEEEIPFFKVGDMNAPRNSTWMIAASNSVSRDTARTLRATIFPKGSVAFPKVGAALLTNKRRLLARPSCVDNNIMVFTPRVGEPRYLLRILEQIDLGQLANPGAVPSVNESQIRDISVPFPGEVEQRAIADFLDCETAKIDDIIEQKQRLIELLQEKRTSLINQAVTKGLDPEVEMTDSGVEWLGEIPAHWRALQLKYLSELQTGLTLGKTYEDQPTVRRPYLRVANVQSGRLDLGDVTEIGVPQSTARRHELQPGDVLMTEGGDFDKLGRGTVWNDQVPGCLHQNHIFAVRPRQSLLSSHFLELVLESSYGRSYFTATSQRSTNLASTSSTKVRSFPVPLPPTEEQASILVWLRKALDQINELVSVVESAVGLLHEYRTALISAAVTGKIDVREMSPSS